MTCVHNSNHQRQVQPRGEVTDNCLHVHAPGTFVWPSQNRAAETTTDKPAAGPILRQDRSWVLSTSSDTLPSKRDTVWHIVSGLCIGQVLHVVARKAPCYMVLRMSLWRQCSCMLALCLARMPTSTLPTSTLKPVTYQFAPSTLHVPHTTRACEVTYATAWPSLTPPIVIL